MVPRTLVIETFDLKLSPEASLQIVLQQIVNKATSAQPTSISGLHLRYLQF